MIRRFCFVASLVFAPTLAAQEHQHSGTPPEQLGRVVFPISCNAEAQQRFERAMALLHSFWWDAAARAFDGVLQADPTCAMAHWGKAMTALANPFGPPTADGLRVGYAALQQAQALPLRTAREREYIGALAEFFRDYDRLDHRTRATAYERAMQELAAHYPDDPEAAIFHARAIVANTPTTDKSFERQKRAGAVLERLFAKRPDHPGLAHYLIHTYDAPPIARLGAKAAEQYSKIAPSVPHAQHMPSHIFTRLGSWDASIQANLASAAAARSYEEAQKSELASLDRVHAWDYLVYAYLQRGQDVQAAEIVEEAKAAKVAPHSVIEYALAAIAARDVLERGRWAEAARLPLRPAPSLRAAEAVTHFARGIGAARSGDLATARTAASALEALRDTLTRQKALDWAQRADAQRMSVEAWIAHADGRADEAVRVATSAAELEELVDKSPVSPGPILPARELLGDMLLEMKRPAEARRVYETALRFEPNRARSLYGAAVAAELAGDRAGARKLYSQVVRLMGTTPTEREEVRRARAFLAAR